MRLAEGFPPAPDPQLGFPSDAPAVPPSPRLRGRPPGLPASRPRPRPRRLARRCSGRVGCTSHPRNDAQDAFRASGGVPFALAGQAPFGVASQGHLRPRSRRGVPPKPSAGWEVATQSPGFGGPAAFPASVVPGGLRRDRRGDGRVSRVSAPSARSPSGGSWVPAAPACLSACGCFREATRARGRCFPLTGERLGRGPPRRHP